jgi:hypothetical protein
MNRFRYNGGMGDTAQTASVEAAASQVIGEREARIRELLTYGEELRIPIEFQLGSVAPAAGATFNASLTNLDFDVLLLGASCTIFKSRVEIKDASRQRYFTQAPVPISSVADIVVSSSNETRRNLWTRPYLLKAKSTLQFKIIADGTETNGVWTFYALQAPTFTA